MAKVVVLTGAGISAESGIKTFRGEDGLWEGHRIEEVATLDAFHANPFLVNQFYNLRRAQLKDPDLKPNAGHIALARLETALGDGFTLITQNVDNLHERAGSKKVWHMHGELQRVRCLQTGETFFWEDDLEFSTPHPKKLNASLRPDIVWFGEVPRYLDESEEVLRDADYFLCIGTSGVVYPAAGFVQWTPPQCYRLEFNLEKTNISPHFDETILGPTGQTLPQWVDQFLQKL